MFSPGEGFRAADTTKAFGIGELNDFKRAVEKWSCHDALPFISLFSDREHAESWGRKHPWNKVSNLDCNWSLNIVDTTQLKATTTFFKLSTLVEKMNLVLPAGALLHVKGAFICMHRIPATALAGQRNPQQVEKGRVCSCWLVNIGGLLDIDRRERKQDAESDVYDYLGECGDDDSDREMLQENWNTIFDKNMEESWWDRV